MQEEIFKTLLTKTESIQDLPKYTKVMAYLSTNPKEVCLYITNMAYKQVLENSETSINDYLNDINFCINVAYEYIYYLELNESARTR